MSEPPCDGMKNIFFLRFVFIGVVVAKFYYRVLNIKIMQTRLAFYFAFCYICKLYIEDR